MLVLEQIGMNRDWIYDVVVTTYHENDPHCAPIGAWTCDFTTLHMDIYKNTKTIANILRWNEFSVNLVSDLTVFYESLFDKTKIVYEKSSNINAPFIKTAPFVIDFKLKNIEEKEQTFHLESVPVHTEATGSRL